MRLSNEMVTKVYGREFMFPSTDLNDQKVMEVERVRQLFEQYKRPARSCDRYETGVSRHFDLIQAAKPSEHILKEIRENTWYEDEFELWNITNLARKYDLTGRKVFLALTKDSSAYGMGMLSDSEEFDYEKYYDTKAKTTPQSENVYVDWVNGRGIKNTFPKDIYSDTTPFFLNMRRYNDRNNCTGYKRIIGLLEGVESRDFIPLKEEDVTPVPDPVVTEREIADFNSTEVAEVYKTALDECLARRRHYYCSHRFNVSDLWPYQMDAFYDSYIQHVLDKCELALMFYHHTAEKTLGICIRSIEKHKISVVNMLIYGKSCVTSISDIDRLLSFVRISCSERKYHDEIQLDNYVYSETGDYPCRYKILWRDDNIGNLHHANTDKDKLLAAKYILQLMNEVDPDKLNFQNYFFLTKWLDANDLLIQYTPHGTPTLPL